MNKPEPSDAEVLRRALTDLRVLGLLYDRHAAAVHAFLRRRVGDAADDLLSEVFLATVANFRRAEPHESGSALPWLYGIAHNLVRNHLRLRTVVPLGEREPAVDWDEVDARLDAVAQRQELRLGLAAISPGDRELLLLVAWDGLSVAEAAEVLGMTPVAARSRLHRARARARQAMAGMGGIAL